MGRIKSSLEIALERTENIKSGKSSIEQYDAKQKGKKLANAYLTDSVNLADEIKKTPEDQQNSLKQGIFDILISMVALPVTKEDEKRIEIAGKGLQLIINDNRFTVLYKQLTQALSQYVKEAAQYSNAILQQYTPRLRQKEEELSRRMGREVHIDPFQDPEFAAVYNQHINALKANYEGAVEQVREEARRLFTGE